MQNNSEGFSDRKVSLSDFNEGGFQILRLHILWCDCSKYSRRGMFDEWKWTLDNIWIELSPDVEKTRNPDAYKKEVVLRDKMISMSKTNNEIYYALKKKQEFLKKLQDDVGKGARRSDRFEEIM